MKRFFFLFLSLLILLPIYVNAQDRTGAVKKLSTLKAATNSKSPEVLPPDGRPWVIFIFKACCSPAEQAARWTTEANVSYGDKVGIIGLNVDPGKSQNKVPNWLKRHEIKYPVVCDATTQAARDWGVIAPPSVIILDKNTNEVYRTMGYQKTYGKKLNEVLDKLLEEN